MTRYKNTSFIASTIYMCLIWKIWEKLLFKKILEFARAATCDSENRLFCDAHRAFIDRFSISRGPSLAAGKLPRYYKCRGFFSPSGECARIFRVDRTRIEDPRGRADCRYDAWICMGDRARVDATKVRFAAESEISAFRARILCIRRAFSIRPGFGKRVTASEECSLQNFITPSAKRSRLCVTLRDAPYYYTMREQCVSPPLHPCAAIAPQSGPAITFTRTSGIISAVIKIPR